MTGIIKTVWLPDSDDEKNRSFELCIEDGKVIASFHNIGKVCAADVLEIATEMQKAQGHSSED